MHIALDYERLVSLICEDMRQHPIGLDWLSPEQLSGYIGIPGEDPR